MDATPEQAKRLKEIELEMLKLFISVCEKLNLKYYLMGGTLLGAVRHKGFIPWDDDIDMGMPRKDYEVFLEKGQALLPEGFFLQTFDTDPEWPQAFAKIRNSNTTFIESSMCKRKINHGAYIDVFPIDYYPETEKEIKAFRRKQTWLGRSITKAISFKPFSKSVQIKGKIFQLITIFQPYRVAVRKKDQLFKSVKSSSKMGNLSSAWGYKEITDASWYGEGREVDFEGIKANAPTEYEKWLTQVYGDYMQLPPEEKRVGHHYADVIDLDTPYTHYVKGEKK